MGALLTLFLKQFASRESEHLSKQITRWSDPPVTIFFDSVLNYKVADEGNERRDASFSHKIHTTLY